MPLLPAEGGELVLENVADGSPLEGCFFLGQLRQPNYDLSKAAKGDMMMKVGGVEWSGGSTM